MADYIHHRELYEALSHVLFPHDVNFTSVNAINQLILFGSDNTFEKSKITWKASVNKPLKLPHGSLTLEISIRKL